MMNKYMMYKYNYRVLLALCLWLCTCLNAAFQPLNILFVVGWFPSKSQHFILNQMIELIDRGHNVFIFSFNRGDCTNPHPDIIKYKLLDRVFYGNSITKLPSCDIVFCQFGYSGRRMVEDSRLRLWLRDKKVVTCFRGADISSRVKREPTMYRLLFKKGDLFLPVCDYFKKKLIKLGCNPNKIIVHHSAINCSQFFFKKREKPQDNAVQLISVCRLVEKKGIEYVVQAFAKLVRKYPAMHYTIIGDGPELENLQKLIKRLNVEGKVTLHGWATQDQVINLLNKSHIFLLPSIISSNGNEEGIPNALKEAMAMGLPVISTWHAGTPELIEDGVSGFLVSERNATELVEKIEYLIEHPDLWESMSVAARKKVENKFNVQKTVERLEGIFYRLLDE
jgi:colanic acid/amylovoran/stewartan biosynthesis glycosyltransferase WcaL/AmsK/CpsK